MKEISIFTTGSRKEYIIKEFEGNDEYDCMDKTNNYADSNNLRCIWRFDEEQYRTFRKEIIGFRI